MEAIEVRMLRLERSVRNHRRAVLSLAAVTLAVLVMGARQEVNPDVPEVIRARRFEVISPRGNVVAELAARRMTEDMDEKGLEFAKAASWDFEESGGVLRIRGEKTDQAKEYQQQVIVSCGFEYGSSMRLQDFGQEQMRLSGSVIKAGAINIHNVYDRRVASLDHGGLVIHQKEGGDAIRLWALDSGGSIHINNKTGEQVVTLRCDEYGNGEVGAWNRAGKGRTLKPGP